MKFAMNFIKEDIHPFWYFMSGYEIKNFEKRKYIFMSIAFIFFAIFFWIIQGISGLVFAFIFGAVGYKLPYLMLKMQHNKNCKEIYNAIPIWINHVCILMEEHTIHHSIISSFDENTPLCIQKDLDRFIQLIETNHEDKAAYLNFLGRYQMEDFKDIMLKLFEYRNVSKERLKYEVYNLNKGISKIENQKRQSRFKTETFIADMCVTLLLGIPCMYMVFISMLCSEIGLQ